MSVTCSTSTCRRTRPTTCTASVAPPAPAPRAMPSASRARSTPCRSRRSRVMSATRFPSPRSPRSSSPPGWWPAPRIRTGRGTQAGTVTVAGAVTGVVGAATAAGRAGAGAGTLPARTVAEVVEPSDETAVALGTPLALSFFLWRPPPAALRPSQAHPASHRGPSRMAEIEDNVDRELFRNMEKLRQLRIEHRDLDEVISRLSLDLHVDELQLKRLKKRKLMLKDQIARLESELIPDLNA